MTRLHGGQTSFLFPFILTIILWKSAAEIRTYSFNLFYFHSFVPQTSKEKHTFKLEWLLSRHIHCASMLLMYSVVKKICFLCCQTSKQGNVNSLPQLLKAVIFSSCLPFSTMTYFCMSNICETSKQSFHVPIQSKHQNISSSGKYWKVQATYFKTTVAGVHVITSPSSFFF